MYIYTYMNIHIHVYIFIYMYIHTYIYTYIHTYIHIFSIFTHLTSLGDGSSLSSTTSYAGISKRALFSRQRALHFI